MNFLPILPRRFEGPNQRGPCPSVELLQPPVFDELVAADQPSLEMFKRVECPGIE